jgi:iron complex outermembrane recepter protein
MNFHAVPRRAPALKPLAIGCALSLILAAGAQAQDEQLPEVTITGARFASDPALAPIGATVITADDIRRAGASDVNQAIRKVGGVYGRQSLDASSDFGLDLRGFGANSGQNLVVMLDGVRLSENDLSGATLSTIPIESVERIEIVRGGSSVLFGDGATGGVIQIITKRPGKNASRGTLRAEAGQFGLRDLRASLATSWDRWSLDAAVGKLRTDNYRDNNEFDQTTFTGGLQWRYGAGRLGLRLDSARQDMQLAGSLTQSQFERDPRQATTARDMGSLDSDRATLIFEHKIGALDLAAELSHREKTTRATFVSTFDDVDYAYAYDQEVEQTQFSPRLRHLQRIGGVLNEVVFGVDSNRWSRLLTSNPFASEEWQRSYAVYARDEMKFDAANNARLAFGVRRENITKSAFVFGGDVESSFNAWDLHASGDVAAGLNLYAKAGRSFRAPNADERGAEKIQSSRDLELGLIAGDDALGATVRAFRHDLTNEIFYDPTIGEFGSNTNLDPTERKGFEIDAHAALPYKLRASAHLQHVNARFTAGVYDGREMVLVPKNVVTARLAWVPGSGHSADVGAQWVDSQRFGADFTNTCNARINSYVTFDARYAYKVGPWEFAVAGLNLADKQYYSNAFGCRGGIYPSDGRQMKVSLRYDF